MPFSDSEAEEMLEACEGAKGLTTWEKSFLESLRELYDGDDVDLSTAQMSKLKQIYEERCT